MTKKFVLVAAGGTGRRMQTEIPKQFLEIHGVPVLVHTMRAFYDSLPEAETILVVHPEWTDRWKNMANEYLPNRSFRLVEGGKTRFDSVRNGLDEIKGPGLVAVHDAVRPLVHKNLINNLFSEAEKNDNAIPAVPAGDTVRIMKEGYPVGMEREQVFLIQTPQVFDVDLLKKAYRKNFETRFTDDATVYESDGHKISLVPGSAMNIKITLEKDLEIAASFLNKRTYSK